MADSPTGDNGAVDYRVTSLLTEHFGFPPLALIDDVINAVNDLLYKCTKAMQTYLTEVKEKQLAQISENEIQIGTGKLETLLESQVDKNFDKFELYSLRNIFTIPPDLAEEGWVRLKHHEGIDFNSQTSKKALDEKITSLINNIGLELHCRKILKLQITKAKKIIKTLRLFQNSLRFLGQHDGEKGLSLKAQEALRSLSPIDETLYFLLNQVEELTKQTRKLYSKVGKDKHGNIDMKFLPDSRDRYIDGKSIQILEKLGLYGEPKEYQENTLGDISGVSDVDTVKKIANILENPRNEQKDQTEIQPIEQKITEEDVQETRLNDIEIDKEIDLEIDIDDDMEI